MIKKQLVSDQITAMKSKDAKRLETYRYILAQIKNAEVDIRTELDDATTVQLIRKEIKKLQDAIVSFEKAGRKDLQADYQSQIDILTPYLPVQISDEELMKKITEVMEKNSSTTAQNPNAIIGICVRELKAIADPSRISKLVQQLRV